MAECDVLNYEMSRTVKSYKKSVKIVLFAVVVDENQRASADPIR